MSERRSLKMWELWRESAEKLDYFVLGTAAALTAYLGQRLGTAPMGANPPTLELASLLLFSGAVVLGLERLRAGVALLGAQHLSLEQQERAGSLKTALLKGGGQPLIEQVSGRTYTVAEASSVISHCEEMHSLAQLQVERWRRRTERAYGMRDWSLALGVVAYAAAKVLAALLAT